MCENSIIEAVDHVFDKVTSIQNRQSEACQLMGALVALQHNAVVQEALLLQTSSSLPFSPDVLMTLGNSEPLKSKDRGLNYLPSLSCPALTCLNDDRLHADNLHALKTRRGAH